MSMSGTSPAPEIDLNHPDLTEVQEIGLPKNPRPLLRRLYDLKLDEKLRRIQQCREFSKFYKCKNDHLHCKTSSLCGLRFACSNCSKVEAGKYVEKYIALERFLPSKFIYATITSKDLASGDSLRHLKHAVLRLLRSISTKTIVGASVSKERTPEIRIIYAHPSTTSERFAALLAAAFPECLTSAAAHLQNKFGFYLDALTAPPNLMPGDPYRADLEFMFEGIRCLHVLGFSRVELSVCKSKRGHTSNSTESPSSDSQDCGRPDTNRYKKCSECGEILNFESKWFRSGFLPKPEEVKFREFYYDPLPKHAGN